MSSIDAYKHKLLGFINCDSDFDIMSCNSTKNIAIYRLDQDIPDDEEYLDGKKGDILLGGGKGEAPAFRISYPESFLFFSNEVFDDFTSIDQLFKAFWFPTQAFILCNGFVKSGWTVDVHIEFWLAEQICHLLSNQIKDYQKFAIDECTSQLNFTLPIAP